MNWFADAFSFLVKGGPVMAPLVACSIISIAVMIERMITLRDVNRDSTKLTNKVENLMYDGNAPGARKVCEESESSVAPVLLAGIDARHGGARHAERAMEERAIVEVGRMQLRLGVLDTIITIAPLLGLLGTVTGMIRSFHVISTKSGMGAPTAITGGVAEALIATATGLAIAIFTLVGYNYLNERVRQGVQSIELYSTQLVNVLADIEERRDEIKPLSA